MQAMFGELVNAIEGNLLGKSQGLKWVENSSNVSHVIRLAKCELRNTMSGMSIVNHNADNVRAHLKRAC